MKTILAISLNPAVDVSSEANEVKPTIKIRTHNQVHHPGGCGVNVARVIAELGGEPDLLYLAGGATGALLKDSLDQLPIKQHRIIAAGATRISYTVHEMQSALEYRFIPEGPALAEEEWERVMDQIDSLDFDFIVATGSLPKNAPEDSYAQIAEIAAAKKAKLILDTSGKALRTTLEQADVFLVKPSLEEMEQLVGKPLDQSQAGQAAMEIIEGCKVQNIVVSLGAQGAILARKTGIMHAPAPDIPIGSAVGAGDSFVGAMTFAVATGVEIEEAFHFGVAAGSAAVMTMGTQLCRAEDVARLYQKEKEQRLKA
jgi:6-phosphofructokinase 2